MRILIVTQAVDRNSPTLGFFVEWIREFSRHCTQVDVIGLGVGAYDLPKNVHVVSMGKERGSGKLKRLFAYWKALRTSLPSCDGVFIHMCPEYLIAGWPLFALWRKPLVFWYAHRARNLLVRIATRLATSVATSVPGAFTMRSDKVHPLGQGVPTDLFLSLPPAAAPPYRFAAVGRLTPIKRLELLVEATALLRKRGIDGVLELWGTPAVPSDIAYETSLREQARALGISAQVHFLGAIPFGAMPEKYADIAVAVNASAKGAIDKAVLEAMSCARPVVVTNENFSKVCGADADACIAEASAGAIADKLEALCDLDRQAIGLRLRAAVVAHHGLPHLVKGVLDLMR